MSKELITVKELIEKLKHCDPTSKVVVERTNAEGYFGPTPFIAISGIYMGFDWDAGYVYIQLENREEKQNEK